MHFTNNIANNGGGAIFNNGTLATIECAFAANRAYIGGAIFNYFQRDITVEKCTFINNIASNGSAISSWQNLTVSNCNFTGNHVTEYCTIYSEGNSTITGCTFYNNTANAAGAIHNYYGNLTTTDCKFENNIAKGNFGNGAAIRNNEGIITVSGSTFTANNANFKSNRFFIHIPLLYFINIFLLFMHIISFLSIIY